MTRKVSPSAAQEPVTLSESDIGSSRSVTRRTVLGALGIGTGIAAAATFGSVTSAAADSPKDKKAAKKSTKKPAPKKPATETDSD